MSERHNHKEIGEPPQIYGEYASAQKLDATRL